MISFVGSGRVRRVVYELIIIITIIANHVDKLIVSRKFPFYHFAFGR